MTCEPCISLLEQGADSLQTSSLDTRQLSLLSGIDMPAKSCESEPPMDGSPSCTCGKGMSDCSIHPNTPEKWIASMRDSLAKTLALLGSRQAYLREPDRVFTAKSCVLLTKLDPKLSSWRTLQQSFLTDSEPFLETWPRVGMTQGGCAYVHPIAGRRITETDGFALPTPTASDNKGGRSPEAAERAGRGPLNNYRDFCRQILGWRMPSLDATEALMGFPTGFTALKHSEMPKSRSKPQSPGNSLEASDGE
jgi:hypothetical protein